LHYDASLSAQYHGFGTEHPPAAASVSQGLRDDFESQNPFRMLNLSARKTLVLLYFVIQEKAKTLKQKPCFTSLSASLYYSYISNQSQSF